MNIDKIKKEFFNKYNINVICFSINREDVLYESNGYKYIASICDFDNKDFNCRNPKYMIRESFIKYINNNYFHSDQVECIDYNDRTQTYTVINHESGYFIQYVQKQNMNTIENKISKPNKYRDKIIEILGSKDYDFSECWPVSSTEKVKIICKEHGPFYSSVANIKYHKSGCPECAKIYKGYTKQTFKTSCGKNNNGNGTLYVVMLTREDECFVKIGITSYNTTDNRFRELRKLGYEIEQIHICHGIPDHVFNCEKQLHKNMKKYKYNPKKNFHGDDECYTLDVL